MDRNTHLGLDLGLCGSPGTLTAGSATVQLHTRADMAADDRGLVHGGFVFGAADHAAMLAVNDPNVVLGSADVLFLSPVSVGEVVDFLARLDERDRRKRKITVTGQVGDRAVFSGQFTCFVLDRHVLDG
jgi:acyl-coenzyme A thioesterase PaaI-like protein